MAMQFAVGNDSGQAGKIDTPTLMNQMKQAGYNPTGMSADGMNITLDDGDGKPYAASVPKLLKGFGWNINSVTPQNVDYENVSPEMRAAVSTLPDDTMRQAYLEGSMKNRGIDKPQVVGSGRDWYVFNPGTSQYIALTNSPHFEAADLAEAGMKGARYVGSSLGGAAGFAVGGGTPLGIAGAAAGAGLAGGGIDALERAALAAHDPAYSDVMDQNRGAIARDVAENAGIDAATGGLFAGAPMAAEALAPGAGAAVKGALENGVGSTAAKYLGMGAEEGGKLARAGAGAVDNPIGRELVASVLPGTSQMQSAAFMAQAPELAMKLGAQGLEGAGNLARSGGEALGGMARRDLYSQARDFGIPAQDALGIAREGAAGGDTALSRAAQAVQSGGQRAGDLGRALQMPRGGRITTLGAEEGAPDALASAGRMGNPMQGPAGPGESTARDFMGNGMEQVGRRIAQRRALLSNADAATKQAAEDAAGQAWGKIGERIGQPIATAAQIGRGLDSAASGIAGGVIKGAKWGGIGAQHGGRLLRGLGTAAQPFENGALVRLGSEEHLKPWVDREVSPWESEAPSDSLETSTTLAAN